MSGTEDTINTDLNEINTSDPFWFNDYTIVFEKSRLTEFFPSHDMSYVEKLNAILRFSLYTAVVIYVYNRNGNVIFIPFITGLITLYLFPERIAVFSMLRSSLYAYLTPRGR